jgi:hypothetical protein
MKKTTKLVTENSEYFLHTTGYIGWLWELKQSLKSWLPDCSLLSNCSYVNRIIFLNYKSYPLGLTGKNRSSLIC